MLSMGLWATINVCLYHLIVPHACMSHVMKDPTKKRQLR